jgi:hypothetical protein
MMHTVLIAIDLVQEVLQLCPVFDGSIRATQVTVMPARVVIPLARPSTATSTSTSSIAVLEVLSTAATASSSSVAA